MAVTPILLLQATSLLMDLGYEFAVSRLKVGTKPSHLLVMGCRYDVNAALSAPAVLWLIAVCLTWPW